VGERVTESGPPASNDDPAANWDDRKRAALARHRAGYPAEAEPVYRDLLRSAPDDADLHHLLGVVALQTGAAARAIDWIEKAIALDGDKAEFFNSLGAARGATGEPTAAEEAFREAIARDPGFADARFNLGAVLAEQGRRREAEAIYREALERAPDHLGALNNLGVLMKEDGRRDDAVEIFRRAAEIAPDDVDTLYNHAESLERLNRRDEAARVVAKLLEIAPASPGGNIIAGALARHAGDFDDAAAHLRRALAETTEPELRIAAHFDLGHTLDRLGQADDAFASFETANRLDEETDAVRGIDRDEYRRELDRDRAWFTETRLAGPSVGIDHGDESPVFLVGFPRSGTTLIERMLDAHPDLFTTEESSPLEYLKQRLVSRGTYPDCLDAPSARTVERWRGIFGTYCDNRFGARGQGRRLVDKLPLNITNLGLIGTVFPNARIVVSLRDPRDVCLSCFMQRFEPNKAMVNFTSLASTVELYADVMGFWLHCRAHTRLAWLEYRYEDLIADYEGTIRKILGFLDVPWHDAIRDYRSAAAGRFISTPSYEAVVEPIYPRASGRWTRYRAQFEPHLAALRPFAETFGYEPD